MTLLANHGPIHSLKNGLLIQKYGDGAATIHRHLARYACDVVRDWRISAQPVTERDAVWKRKDKRDRQIVVDGDKLDMEAVWEVRDGFFPAVRVRKNSVEQS